MVVATPLLFLLHQIKMSAVKKADIRAMGDSPVDCQLNHTCARGLGKVPLAQNEV